MDDVHTRDWLSALLTRQRAAVVAGVTAEVFALPGTHYRGHGRDEVATWVDRGFEALLTTIMEASSEPITTYAQRLSRDRRALGFRIDEVVSAVLLFQQVVGPLIATADGPQRMHARAFELFSATLRELVGRFVGLFSEAMEDSVAMERARTELMLEVVEAAGATLDVEMVLRRAARGVALALDVPWCTILFPDATDQEFRPRASVGKLGDRHEARLRTRVFERAGEPIIGEPAARREPVVFRSEEGHCLLCGGHADQLGVAAAVSLPIIRGDRLLAVALAASMDTNHEFRPEQIQLAWGLANLVAPAIDNARLHEGTERQLAESRAVQRVLRALVEERETATILGLVCDEARRYTDADACAVLLQDAEEDGPLVAARSGPASGPPADFAALARRAAADGGYPGDVAAWTEPGATAAGGATSVLAVPLGAEGDTRGVLLLVGRAGGFAAEPRRVVLRLADHAALALATARLRGQRERVAVLEERERLAHDLHDSVSQSLYGVTMFAEAAARLLEAGDPAGASEHLRDVRDTSLDALRQMRLLIFELRPPDLKQRGLAAVIEARLQAVEARAKVATDFSADLPERLPLRVEEALLGITQEALNNALRHAHATRIRVRLERRDDDVRLEICDDGPGFDLEAGRRRGGFGLRGMAERAAKVQGRLTVDRQPGGGARVTVVVPAAAAGHRAGAARPREREASP